MTRMLSPQNRRNEIHCVVGKPLNVPPSSRQPGAIETKNACSAAPPIHALMPNQPHAINARISAGRFEPVVPYAARANTGNGMPYLVPACELSRIGASTIRLSSRIVSSACHHDMPLPIRPDAIVYVGMQCAIEIHSAE